LEDQCESKLSVIWEQIKCHWWCHNPTYLLHKLIANNSPYNVANLIKQLNRGYPSQTLHRLIKTTKNQVNPQQTQSTITNPAVSLKERKKKKTQGTVTIYSPMSLWWQYNLPLFDRGIEHISKFFFCYFMIFLFTRIFLILFVRSKMLKDCIKTNSQF
jgi:hypothetical protein